MSSPTDSIWRVSVMTRMDPIVKEWLRIHAARQGISMSAAIEQLVQREMSLTIGLEALNDLETRNEGEPS